MSVGPAEVLRVLAEKREDILSSEPEKKVFYLTAGALGLASVAGKGLKNVIVGQDEYIDALLTAVLAREHLALISPPGTAKSLLVELFTSMLDGASIYKTLLNPYITFDELFGPLDPKSIMEGKYKRLWSNIVRSEMVFLDEGFKASKTLLNSLLSLLNERRVFDNFEGQEVKAKLHTAVVASNEVPEEEELQALWDRIAVRVYGDYPSEPSIYEKMLKGYWRRMARLPRRVIPFEAVELLSALLEQAYSDKEFSKELADELSSGAYNDMLELYTAVIEKPFVERIMSTLDTPPSPRTLTAKLPKIWLARTLLALAEVPSPVYAMAVAARDVVKWLAPSPEDVDEYKSKAEQLVPDSIVELGRKIGEVYRDYRAGRITADDAIARLEAIKQDAQKAAVTHVLGVIAKYEIERLIDKIKREAGERSGRLQPA